jgi:hypothetical protein
MRWGGGGRNRERYPLVPPGTSVQQPLTKAELWAAMSAFVEKAMTKAFPGPPKTCISFELIDGEASPSGSLPAPAAPPP